MTPVFSGVPENITLNVVPGRNATTDFSILVTHQFNLTFSCLDMMNVTQTAPNNTTIYSGTLGHEFKLTNETVEGVPQNPITAVANGTIPIVISVSVPQGTKPGSYSFLLVLDAYGPHNKTNLMDAHAIKVILNVE